MTGENGRWRSLSSVQPGGRPPAPGELALVQAFINSHYDLELEHGADLFASPSELRRWLSERGLVGRRTAVHQAELERAVAIREALRELAAEGGGRREALQTLNRASTGAAVEVRFGTGGPWFAPHGHDGVEAALGLVVAITARAMISGEWARLKVCRAAGCGWAFYDHSRNRSGRWCSMSVCGSRAKARAHYQRSRGEL